MKILHSIERRGKKTWVVECPPQRILTPISSTLYDLPMPWTYYTLSIYDRNGAFGADRRSWTRMHTVLGRPKQWQKRSALYYLPLPNLYPNSLTFCGNGGYIQNEPKKEIDLIAQAINIFWAGNFSYLRPLGRFMKVWDAFAEAAKANKYNMAMLYSHWESLSIDEICEFPWGKISVGTLDVFSKSRYFAYDTFH